MMYLETENNKIRNHEGNESIYGDHVMNDEAGYLSDRFLGSSMDRELVDSDKPIEPASDTMLRIQWSSLSSFDDGTQVFGDFDTTSKETAIAMDSGEEGMDYENHDDARVKTMAEQLKEQSIVIEQLQRELEYYMQQLMELSMNKEDNHNKVDQFTSREELAAELKALKAENVRLTEQLMEKDTKTAFAEAQVLRLEMEVQFRSNCFGADPGGHNDEVSDGKLDKRLNQPEPKTPEPFNPGVFNAFVHPMGHSDMSAQALRMPTSSGHAEDVLVGADLMLHPCFSDATGIDAWKSPCVSGLTEDGEQQASDYHKRRPSLLQQSSTPSTQNSSISFTEASPFTSQSLCNSSSLSPTVATTVGASELFSVPSEVQRDWRPSEKADRDDPPTVARSTMRNLAGKTEPDSCSHLEQHSTMASQATDNMDNAFSRGLLLQITEHKLRQNEREIFHLETLRNEDSKMLERQEEDLAQMRLLLLQRDAALDQTTRLATHEKRAREEQGVLLEQLKFDLSRSKQKIEQWEPLVLGMQHEGLGF